MNAGLRVFSGGLGALFLGLAVLSFSGGLDGARAQENFRESREQMLQDADHFELRRPRIESLAQWEQRRETIRRSLLLSAGLWPTPEKNPLEAQIFEERQGDGFRVAKVYYQSLPGYLATGNLYRPTRGNPPYPAVICPHGHWTYGRLQNGESGSIPGRCIDFARMGFVVLSIDMVGFNDNFQFPHDGSKSRAQLKADVPQPYEPRLFRADFDFPVPRLYGFTLGGLQVLNCIRGVDLLCSLPEVDTTRIAATGASGGASQTIFLMTADRRIKAAAPVNIIGAAKHPGCLCENLPGLWVDASTVEMAAAFAPRPLLLMSATEDPWTNSTPTREYPIIKSYYDLYGAGDMVKNVHIAGGHNYNAQTRAAVYQWFSRHLKSQFPPIENPEPVSPEPKNLGDLRVFPDHLLPEVAVNGSQVIRNWERASERAFAGSLPQSQDQLGKFADTFGKALAQVLALEKPADQDLVSSVKTSEKVAGVSREVLLVGRKGRGDCFEIESVASISSPKGTLVLVCPEEMGGLLLPDKSALQPWIAPLLKKGYKVVRVRGYASGQYAIPRKVWDSFSWPDAYNRDNRLNGIQDILTALCQVRTSMGRGSLTVVGLQRCGLLAALACAAFAQADRVLVDLNRNDPGYDGELLEILPVGGIKRVGDFRTAALLLMQKPLTLFNAANTFDSGWLAGQAAKLGLRNNLDLRLSESGTVFADWL